MKTDWFRHTVFMQNQTFNWCKSERVVFLVLILHITFHLMNMKKINEHIIIFSAWKGITKMHNLTNISILLYSRLTFTPLWALVWFSCRLGMQTDIHHPTACSANPHAMCLIEGRELLFVFTSFLLWTRLDSFSIPLLSLVRFALLG